jgi:hypothetical protein
MILLGIDPSQRHTGLCLLTETGPLFHEIKPTEADVLSSAARLRQGLTLFLEQHAQPPITTYVVEKQLSVGARSSALLFHMQMTVLDVIADHVQRGDPSTPTFILPLPIQLQSYIRKRHGFGGTTATQLVRHFKRVANHPGLISQHCVDAYYLTQLGKDVLEGTWSYPLPSREVPLIPWPTTNGNHPT